MTRSSAATISYRRFSPGPSFHCLLSRGRFFRWILTATLLTAALWPAGSPLSADDAQTRAAVNRLFELGWSARVSQRAEGDRYYSQMRATVSDRRFDYAYGLLLLKQRRYREAVPHLQALQKVPGSDIAPEIALTWTQVLTRKYSQALTGLDRLSRQLASQLYEKDGTSKKLTATSQASINAGIGHLAGLLAFLDYPVRDQTSAQLRAQYRDRIVARFKGPALDTFRRSQQRVIDEFNRLQTGIEAADKVAQAQAAKRRQDDIRDLAEIRKAIGKRRDELKDRRDELREDAKKERDRINDRARPLNRELASLEAEAGAAARQRATLRTELSLAYRQLRRTRDPELRSIIRRDISRIEISLARFDADLYLADARASNVLNERARLALESRGVEGEYRDRLRESVSEESRLDKRAKRTVVQERRLRDARGGTSRSVRGMSAKARALATYLDLPEVEKLRIQK